MENRLEIEQQINRSHTPNRSVVVGGEREWLIWDEADHAVDLSNIFGADPNNLEASKKAGPDIEVNKVYFSTKDEKGQEHFFKLERDSRMNEQKGHLDWLAKLTELESPDNAKDTHIGNWQAIPGRIFNIDQTTMSQDNITVGFGVYYIDETGQQINLGVANKIAAPRADYQEILSSSDLLQLQNSGEIFASNE